MDDILLLHVHGNNRSPSHSGALTATSDQSGITWLMLTRSEGLQPKHRLGIRIHQY